MIQLNKNIFDRIKSLVTEFGGHTEFQEKICINTSLEEKDWIQHATFKNDGGYNEMTKVSCQNGLSFGEIYYKDSRYIVINDDFDYELDKASFQFQEPNSGIFTILLSQEFINANEDSLSELYELHLFSDGTNALRKLSFDDIDSCFSGFCLIKVDSEVFISANLNTIVCHLLNEKAKQDCKKKKLYDEHLYLPLNDLILNGHETIPFDIIVHGIGNFDHPKTLYLDLYRSLERLYVSSYMSNLKKVLDIQISHEDLSEKIENVTGWRPKEEPALIELLSLL
ncbi:hypothetical protein N6C58_004334, partial [Vibrio fluvialis]|nr:hypothetical protein [Vibrio fluvialis]